MGIDALLPPDMALRAEEVGAKKARGDAASLLMLAILAGAFIAVGALFAMTIAAAAGPLSPAITKVLGGLAFSLAFVLVVVGGAELFTSNNLMVMALVSRRITAVDLLRAWVIIYIGNLIGTLFTGALAVLAGLATRSDGGLGRLALSTVRRMTDLGTLETFFVAVLGNVLVCLAAWVSYSGRTTTDRILAVVPPIVAFYAMQLEHVIATMFYFPLAYFVSLSQGSHLGLTGFDDAQGRPIDVLDFALHLAPVTLGNIVGGGVLVGVVYWFVYLHPRRRKQD